MKKYIILSILTISLFSNCGEDFFDQVVDVKIPEHVPSLAITSSMSNTDTILWAYVSNSVGILEPENPDAITDATVELYKNGELFQAFPHINQGFYGWEIDQPIDNDGATYELKVSKEGFESVSATQTVPDLVTISKATFEKDGTIDIDGERVDEVIVEFQDKADEQNFYKIESRLSFTGDDGVTFGYEIQLESNDPSTRQTNDGLYFSDVLFDGDLAELRLWNYEIYFEDDIMFDPELKISVVNVSPEKYYRELSIYNYDPENPFAEPTIIFSNIENGYGIFSMEATGPEFTIEL